MLTDTNEIEHLYRFEYLLVIKFKIVRIRWIEFFHLLVCCRLAGRQKRIITIGKQGFLQDVILRRAMSTLELPKC